MRSLLEQSRSACPRAPPFNQVLNSRSAIPIWFICLFIVFIYCELTATWSLLIQFPFYDRWTMLLLQTPRSNQLGSRSLNHGTKYLEQEYHSYAMDWAIVGSGRHELLAACLWNITETSISIMHWPFQFYPISCVAQRSPSASLSLLRSS